VLHVAGFYLCAVSLMQSQPWLQPYNSTARCTHHYICFAIVIIQGIATAVRDVVAYLYPASFHIFVSSARISLYCCVSVADALSLGVALLLHGTCVQGRALDCCGLGLHLYMLVSTANVLFISSSATEAHLLPCLLLALEEVCLFAG
jgi:hypothetical protein